MVSSDNQAIPDWTSVVADVRHQKRHFRRLEIGHLTFKFRSSTEFWFDSIHQEKVILPITNDITKPRPCDRVEALTYPVGEVGAGNVIMLCNGANRPLSIGPAWTTILPTYKNKDVSTGALPTPPGFQRLDLYKAFLSRAILHECMHASDLVACTLFLFYLSFPCSLLASLTTSCGNHSSLETAVW